MEEEIKVKLEGGNGLFAHIELNVGNPTIAFSNYNVVYTPQYLSANDIVKIYETLKSNSLI